MTSRRVSGALPRRSPACGARWGGERGARGVPYGAEAAVGGGRSHALRGGTRRGNIPAPGAGATGHGPLPRRCPMTDHPRDGVDPLPPAASRRRVLEALAGVALGVVALVGLAGCGGDDEDDDDEGDD